MSTNHILEVLFITHTNEQQLTCSALDYRTGTNLMNYKGGGGGAATHTLCLAGADIVLTANISKPLLHVWPINKQEQITNLRFVMPGQVSAMVVSPDLCYLVAGIQETIYIWNINTGRMLNSVSKHYQAISCLKFTDDAEYFISGGKDGAVIVWSVTSLVQKSYDGEDKEPVYSFNDHGLPVTDIHVGAGALRAYMYTVSLDRSCKIYDLFSGSLLLTVVFPEGLQSIIVNALESKAFVGTIRGNIFEFNMIKPPRVKEYHVEEDSKPFIGHSETSAIKCLALSLDGQTLVSAADDGQLLIWHISSRQLIKTIPFKGAINNICLQLTSYTVFDPEHKIQNVFKSSLKRMIDSTEADEEEEISLLINDNNHDEYTEENYINHDFLPLPLDYLLDTSNDAISTSTTMDYQEDVESLRKEVERLRKANKKLFELSIKQVFNKNN